MRQAVVEGTRPTCLILPRLRVVIRPNVNRLPAPVDRVCVVGPTRTREEHHRPLPRS